MSGVTCLAAETAERPDWESRDEERRIQNLANAIRGAIEAAVRRRNVIAPRVLFRSSSRGGFTRLGGGAIRRGASGSQQSREQNQEPGHGRSR
jgi:hypothetical protein